MGCMKPATTVIKWRGHSAERARRTVPRLAPHAGFTDSPLPTLAAEADHRRHAIIEQVIADLNNGPLAHLPLGTLRRELGLAGPRHDRVQPAPCRRWSRLGVSRSSQHRNGRTTYDCLTAVHRRKARPEPSEKAGQTGSCHTPVPGPDTMKIN
jgi:hypothetical protein